MKKFLLCILLLIVSTCSLFAQESDLDTNNKDLILAKSQVLVKKGMKAEADGDWAEAIIAYDEAYDVCKSNILPLLKLAQVYAKTQNFSLAEKRLEEIPLERLNNVGKGEVYLLRGKIACAKDTMGVAGDNFRNALRVSPKSNEARIRLALVNLLSGINLRAEELLAKETDFSHYNFEDWRMALAVDFDSANFSRAYDTCCLFSDNFAKASPDAGFFERIQMSATFLFVSLLPIFLNKYISLMYFAIIFVLLGIEASALTKKSNYWHIVTFVFAGVALMFAARNFCIMNVYKALLASDYYLFSELWLLPRVLITSHLVALALFFIFPIFRVLKENMRPVTYELLGIWLFCCFFSIFVLTFQSDMDALPRFGYMMISLFASVISALIMPFGKLLLFKLSTVKGLSVLGKVDSNIFAGGVLSFTDLKILEDKIWNLIDKGDLVGALSLGRKNSNNENLKNSPKLWCALIFIYTCLEEYEIAIKNMTAFGQLFMGTEIQERSQIYEAYIKTEKGDFPIAYKLVNAISDQAAKDLNDNEKALSLLVLGRCCLNLKDFVQAHINYNKAFGCAKSQFVKHIILTDMAELDCKMNAKQAMQKWKAQLVNLFGGNKCKSYRNLISSMIAYSEEDIDKAMALAKESVSENIINGKALAWYGHLLCLEGKTNEAEEVLAKMTNGSYVAECLMTEVTSQGLV